MPAKTVPGRKAGEDHARSQCPLRGDARPFGGKLLHPWFNVVAGARAMPIGGSCLALERSTANHVLKRSANFWRPAVLLPDEVGLASCRWSGALVLAANFDLSNAEVRSILQQTAENLGLKQEH